MEILQIRPQSLQSPKTHFMNPLFSKLNPRKFPSFFSIPILKPFCTTTTTKEPISLERYGSRNSEVVGAVRAKVAAEAAQLKENWLDSLTCPFPHETQPSIYGGGLELPRINAGSEWVVGIDPDLSGALALLKCDQSGCSAQVFDSPHLKVLVGKRIRKRLDAKSIVQLLRGFDAPVGTTAYIEQSIPYPQDGKQGWWSGGFGYGLWIGILVASGFSVVPVPSLAWKNKFQLSGRSVTKDDSRKIASTLFPSLSSSLKRKKDHVMELFEEQHVPPSEAKVYHQICKSCLICVKNTSFAHNYLAYNPSKKGLYFCCL